MSAILSAVLGSGLLIFWAAAIARGELAAAAEPWPGHRRHEASFLVPDVAMGVALLASLVVGPGLADGLRMLAGGGLMFLGLQDFGYLIFTWPDRSPAMRLRTAVISAVALCGGLALWLLALGG